MKTPLHILPARIRPDLERFLRVRLVYTNRDVADDFEKRKLIGHQYTSILPQPFEPLGHPLPLIIGQFHRLSLLGKLHRRGARAKHLFNLCRHFPAQRQQFAGRHFKHRADFFYGIRCWRRQSAILDFADVGKIHSDLVCQVALTDVFGTTQITKRLTKCFFS
jgi:hypothetical protein